MELHENQRAILEQAQRQSWPDLVGQLVMDFTKVLEAEARLMRASIEPSLSSVLEHWLTHLIIAAIAMTGCLLLVGAMVLLLHTWLAWWLCFAIVGAATLLLALCGLLTL